MKKIFVTEPVIPEKAVFYKYLNRALDSKRLTNDGPLVNELTEKLCEYLDVKNLLLVANGTSAISLATKVLDVKKTVLTTPFSWVASSSTPLWDGIPIMFSDISKTTFNMDINLINEKLASESVGAILPVHVYGCPADVIRIDAATKDSNIPVIYDAAHAFGVKFQGESILNFGDISTLSLHSTKLFHTVEGGLLAFKDSNALEEGKMLINFGQKNGLFERLGFNFKLSEVHAAMGLALLHNIDKVIERKKYIFEYYYKYLKDAVVFQEMNHLTDWNYAYCPILIESESKALSVLKSLEDKLIFARRYFYPSLNTLKFLPNNPDCSVSEDISSRVICLPSFQNLQDSEMDLIINTVLEKC